VPPPFPAKTILNFAKDTDDKDMDPIELIVRVLVSPKDFDTEHDDNKDYNKGGLEKSEQLVG
jgi:hypothetical protein